MSVDTNSIADEFVKRTEWARDIDDKSFYYLLLVPAAIGMTIVFVIPTARAFQLAFYEHTLVADPEFIGIDNYIRALNHDLLTLAVRNSVIWTALGVLTQFSLGLFAALIADKHFRGRKLFRAAMIVPWVTPTIVTAIVWRWMYNTEYGIFNEALQLLGIGGLGWLSNPDIALYSVIIVNTWKGFPFFFIMLLAGLQSIPNDLYEAARVDGANTLQQFWYITLPQLKPMIVISTVFGTVWTFNYFDLIWSLTQGGPSHATEILPIFVYREAFVNYSFGYASAIALIIFAFNFIFVVSYVKVLFTEDS